MRTLLLLALAASPMAAHAQEVAAEGAAVPSQYASMLPLLFIFVIFWVLLIRPQQKRMKEHQQLLTELKKGDDVVTGGGILGKITKVDGDTLTVEIAKGVEVNVLKATVTSVVGKKVKPANDKKKNDNSTLAREKVANDN